MGEKRTPERDTANLIAREEPRTSKRRSGSAGINRQEAEDERSSRERSSDPLGPEFCVGHREVHSEA